MNQVDALIRFGYALVIVTMLLMVWASLVGARELESNKHPPCLFSPLCTCSKASPNDLGIIQCKNVPYPAIPRTLNNSKVFMLHMESTGLQSLPSSFLQGTGLYRIEISHNPLGEVLEGAFDGLERSLWELSLHHNQLVEVPSRALHNLKKLKLLDLSNNHIDCIELDSFFGLDGSLERLILADNSIDSLPRGAFTSLPKLDTIDLSGNNIAYLDPSIFEEGMPSLAKLLLSNNALRDVPYNALAPLRNLRVLDLSHNLIKTIRIENDTIASKLTLDVLHLEFNRIEEIPTASFAHFDVVNVTYLDGNPLNALGERAFESARIRELYIRHCGLSFVSPASFDGLDRTLQILDISGNNLTALPMEFLKGFTEFKALNIKDNKFGSNKEMQLSEVFSAIWPYIEKFDMSGKHNGGTNLKNFNQMRSLRSLSVGMLSSSNLAPDFFIDYGVELEDVKFTQSSIESIKSHTFRHIRGVRRLDLSENNIGSIDTDAFTEIGHSLTSLKIAHGLSGSFTAFPAQSFRTLTSLQELDLSNNQLKSISDTSFHFLNNLRTVELNDNVIEKISKGTFQGDIHSKLEILALHYNSMKKIEENTFVDLKELTRLQLDDNRITAVEKGAFMNLNKLKYLTLRGNKLDLVSDEAFQIGGNDPLPNRICIQCEQDVNVFYIKIKRFQTLDKKWRDEIQQTNSSHPYLQIEEHYSGEIDKIRKKVDAYMIHEQNHNDLQDPLDSNDVQPIQQNDEVPKEEMASVAEKTTPDIEFEQKQLEKERDKKRRQKRQKFAGYIRSRKLKRRLKAQVEQQVLNPVIVQPTDKNTIPKAEMPYKKYRNDILEIISQNEILVSRTRVNRRTAQPFNYNVISSKPQVCPKKKVTMKKEPAASHDHDVLGPLTEKTKSPQMSLDTSPSIQPRQRRRINYSEELVDEAFMYEQILHDKQKSQEKRKKCIPKVAELTQNINDSMGSVALSVSSPANLDSRLRLLEQRNEISIMPLKSRMMTKDPASKFDSKMPIPLKIEPLFNITSSVSVFKPRKSDQAPSSLQISNITSLHTYRAGPSSKRQKFSCTYCTKTFADEKQLAEHNMDHLHVSLNKIDAVQVLKPKLRRGRMLNLDDNQYIRCVNCWKLHTNNKSILDHWNNGACLFYCMICEKSFHDNIKDLKSHFESEHGVKYRTMLLLKRDPLKNEEPVKKPDSPKQPSMQVNSLMPDLLRKPGPANRKPVHKKPAAGQEPNHLLSGEMRCELCNRTFIHRKAYRAHYTLSHKKKQNFDVSANDGAKQDVDKKAINPMAVASGATKSSKNQKKNFGKNWKKRTNEAVMKTVIRKAPKRHIPVTVSSNKQQPVATRKLVEPMTIGETLVQCTTISTPLKAQNRQDLQVSQDQTVSSTFLPTSAVYNDTDIQIKPEPEAEPMENYPINYPEVPVQSCNGWVQPQQQEQQQEQQHEQQQEQQPPLQPPPLASLSSLPPQPQYDAWNQNVAVDPYLDTSPRLKVKDLTDLQVPNQRHPIESQGYQQNVVYKEQPLIMPNQNMTGLQIQNVQSYQPHPVQPNPIQTYVDYSCMNSMGTSMSTSMTMPEQGMCTSNLYEMHISQAQQVQNTQFINPVFLLPTNSTHAVQDYHY